MAPQDSTQNTIPITFTSIGFKNIICGEENPRSIRQWSDNEQVVRLKTVYFVRLGASEASGTGSPRSLAGPDFHFKYGQMSCVLMPLFIREVKRFLDKH